MDAVEEEEAIPSIITEEYFKTFQENASMLIKNFRESGSFEVAYHFAKILTVCENLNLTLNSEKAKVLFMTENHVDATGRVEQAVRVSQRDRDTIVKLRGEVVEAWSLMEDSKKREIQALEKLEEMRQKFNEQQQELLKYSSRVDDSELGQMGKHKVTVVQEVERLTGELEDMSNRLQVQRIYSDEVQKKLDDSLEKNRDLFHQWDEATNESMSNKKQLESLKKKTEQLEESNDDLTQKLNHFKTQSESRFRTLKERERQLGLAREELEKLRASSMAMAAAKGRVEMTFKVVNDEFIEMQHAMDQSKHFMRLKEDECRKLETESERSMKKMEGLMRKIAVTQMSVTRKDLDLQNQKNEMTTIEIERDAALRSNDNLKKDMQNLQKKAELLLKGNEKRDEMINSLKTEKALMTEKEILMTNDLNQSAARENLNTQTIKKLIVKLESVESEKLYMGESLNELKDELSECMQKNEKNQRLMEEAKVQLAHYKHEYNTAVANLTDARADYQQCREKEADVMARLAILKNQVEDTNNNLTAKMVEIVGLQKKIRKSEKENRELNRDLQRCGDVVNQTREEVKLLRHENKLHKEALRKNDAMFVKMKNQMDKILRERDLIAHQMLRRTDESEILLKEVLSLKMIVQSGDTKYNNRLEDIQMMTTEIIGLRSQCNVLKRGLQNTADMRHEVLILHRKLNQERALSKVLASEMITPMNVHRWRKLHHGDPKHSKMLKKCQRAQKNSMLQAAKVLKYEEVVKALEGKIEMLELELSRRPEKVIHEKLMITRSQMNMNEKRMKAAIAISRATVGDVCRKDETINKLEKDLYEVKSHFLKEKTEKTKLLIKYRDLKKDEKTE